MKALTLAAAALAAFTMNGAAAAASSEAGLAGKTLLVGSPGRLVSFRFAADGSLEAVPLDGRPGFAGSWEMRGEQLCIEALQVPEMCWSGVSGLRPGATAVLRGPGGAAVSAALDVDGYDPAAWREDFRRLRQAMAQGYANLDWVRDRRNLDLAELAAGTERTIAEAGSATDAYLALNRFVAAFGDPHLKLQLAEARGSAPDQPSAPPAVAGCEEAGYREGRHGFALPYEAVPGWTSLRGGNFPAGMLDGTGVLRIAQFGEDQYLSACREVFTEGLSRRALQLKVRAALQAELREAIAQLRSNGARRLLIDLTGNGGGSEWAREAIALFTDRRMVRAAPQLVGPACDRSAVWEGAAPCSPFGPERPASSVAGEGAWTGPVLILADRRTASAAEEFAAWLQQNEVAAIVGERSAGAGCGYVDGGADYRFQAGPVAVLMPNCARFLADGTNEIEGIAPDTALPMAEPAQAAEALAALLGN